MQHRQQREIVQLNIRRVAKEDTERISALYKQLGYAISKEQLRARVDMLVASKEHALYLAELPDGELAGWIHAYIGIALYIDPVIFVRELIVDREMRYIGAEQALLQVIEQWAREQACSAIFLWSETLQQKDPRFYHGFGYSLQSSQVLRKLLTAPDIRVLH
ncbi:MAG TPA: GNAT family N-acetyltransferase [Ktedonobacteraceae bacterium]|jgi:GNAT superfamily N-acetyltransferase|nr:GNAT family N-acetyltransferase [Ktedonobacteraceae bacterium]